MVMMASTAVSTIARSRISCSRSLSSVWAAWRICLRITSALAATTQSRRRLPPRMMKHDAKSRNTRGMVCNSKRYPGTPLEQAVIKGILEIVHLHELIEAALAAYDQHHGQAELEQVVLAGIIKSIVPTEEGVSIVLNTAN